MTIKPDFVVIGAMKCGTTSLWHYLREHPQVHVPHDRKNLEYFVDDDNFNRGDDWYGEFFATDDTRVLVRGEISTEYTKDPVFSGVAERIASYLPDAKLIYLIRDPIQRMLSHYVHQINAAKEQRDVVSAFSEPGNSYIAYSLYGHQISLYRKYYGPDQIQVLWAEDLLASHQVTLTSLYEFLGVDTALVPADPIRVHTADEKRQWNALGRYIRRSPQRHDRFKYYQRRLPAMAARLIASATGRTMRKPVIPDGLVQELRARFDDDAALLADQLGGDRVARLTTQ